MKETQVKFVIGKNGAIQMDVLNGEGESCVDITQTLETSLMAGGGQKTEEGKKPEYFDASSTDVFNNLNG